MIRFLSALLVLLLPAAASAQCGGGANVFDDMDAESRARIIAAADAQPYPRGNLWRATKDGAEITILGTYHFPDPRHDPTIAAVSPMITAAGTLLVEAGPEEEARLMQAMADNPDTMFITEGPSLLEQLGEKEWAEVAEAMALRGIPPFMAAKFKPWYVSIMLGMPPCPMDPAAFEDGLDQRVVAVAEGVGVPIRSLEPYDTILKLFDQLSPEDQLNMIRSTILLEDRQQDVSFTVAEEYFAGNSREVWEYMRILSREMGAELQGLTPEQSDAEFAKFEELLANARNRSWIPVIEGASAEGNLFVAFGALHLSGEEGVLNLLEQRGWALEQLPL